MKLYIKPVSTRRNLARGAEFFFVMDFSGGTIIRKEKFRSSRNIPEVKNVRSGAITKLRRRDAPRGNQICNTGGCNINLYIYFLYFFRTCFTICANKMMTNFQFQKLRKK